MGMGSMIWTGLLLIANATAPDAWYMNARSFTIPIRFRPESRADIQELLLFVSTDKGESWQLQGRVTPDKESFLFKAPEDGNYAFVIAVMDKANRQTPSKPDKADANMRVIVDTARPELRITRTERHGDEVVVGWTAHEDYPNTETLRLEYRPYRPNGNDNDPWTPVGLLPNDPQVSFRPNIPGPIELRLQLKDQAGNLGEVRQVVASAAPVSVTQAAITSPGATPPRDGGANWMPYQSTGVVPTAAHAAPPPLETVQPTGTTRPESGGTSPTAVPTAVPPAPSLEMNNSLATNNTLTPLGSGIGAGAMAQQRGSLPRLRLINQRQINLEFEVSKVGPSGLGSVEVYATADDGKTWRRVPGEPKASLQAPSEPHGSTAVRGTVVIPLSADKEGCPFETGYREGVPYGFYLVVKSRVGLGKPPPHGGEVPQVRVELDTTEPIAQLFLPLPDETQRDTLILRWEATDNNFGVNPVTLEFAEHPDGPWKPIGEPHLPNTKHYAWRVPEGTPLQIHLKLTVRDAAGNVAVAATLKPIAIDMSVPELGGVRIALPSESH